jgi:hypothetical protein
LIVGLSNFSHFGNKIGFNRDVSAKTINNEVNANSDRICEKSISYPKKTKKSASLKNPKPLAKKDPINSVLKPLMLFI